MSESFKYCSFIISMFLLDFCIYKMGRIIDFERLLSPRPSAKYALHLLAH